MLGADEKLVDIQGQLHDVRIIPPCNETGVVWTNENPAEEVFIIVYDETSLVNTIQ